MRRPAPDGRTRLSLPSRRDLLHDLVAGLTVGASQVGNAMAYTMLAGVPPVHGLYAVAAGTPAGALTAGSQRMPIVPTAALCLAAGGALADAAGRTGASPACSRWPCSPAPSCWSSASCKAGGLVRFISNAVMIGLMAGIGVTILLSQLGALTGFSSRYDNKLLKAADLFMHPGASDVETTVIGLATVLLVVVLRRTRLKLFAMALALLVMTVAVGAARRWTSVAVVGDIAPIPRALPWPQLPDFSLVPALLVPALSLVIIGLVQGAGISRTVPNADGSFGDTSRDFVGQGVANVFSGCFSGGVVGGSVQATALNVGAGARTRWSSVITAAFVVLVILAAAPLVQQVPLAVTAGILIVAATSALQPRAALDVWRADKMSAAVMLVTFVLVLVVPLQYAVLAGAAISVLKYIYLASLDVHVTQVVTDDDGRLRETEAPSALASESVTVLDIYGSLFFAAAPKIRESLPSVGDAHCPVVVLRLRGRGTLHSATIAVIREYAGECAARGGRLYLAGVGPGDGGAAAAHRRARHAGAGRGGGGDGRALRRVRDGPAARGVVACRARGRTAPGPPGGLRRAALSRLSTGPAGVVGSVVVAGKPALRVLAAPVVEGRGRELARRPRRPPCGTRPSRWASGPPPACPSPASQRYSTRSGNPDHHGQVSHVASAMRTTSWGGGAGTHPGAVVGTRQRSVVSWYARVRPGEASRHPTAVLRPPGRGSSAEREADDAGEHEAGRGQLQRPEALLQHDARPDHGDGGVEPPEDADDAEIAEGGRRGEEEVRRDDEQADDEQHGDRPPPEADRRPGDRGDGQQRERGRGARDRDRVERVGSAAVVQGDQEQAEREPRSRPP